jgi:hypothetical protein
MKNIYEVLRQKELQVSHLEKEVEALRLVAPLLSEDKQDQAATAERSRSAAVPKQRASVPPIDSAGAQTRPTGTEGTAHRWP